MDAGLGAPGPGDTTATCQRDARARQQYAKPNKVRSKGSAAAATARQGGATRLGAHRIKRHATGILTEIEAQQFDDAVAMIRGAALSITLLSLRSGRSLRMRSGRSHRPAVRKARPLTCSRRPRSAHRPIRSSRRPPAAAPRSARAAHQAGASPGFATRDGVGSAPAVPTSCVSRRVASPRSPTLVGCADAKAVHSSLGRRPLAGQVPVRDRWIRRDRAEVSAAARTLRGSCASPTDGR